MTLLFTANTLRELERHKDGVSAGRRDVARKITAWLRQSREAGQSHGYPILFRPKEPVTFPEGLSPQAGDDCFIASLLEAKAEGHEVAALTDDFLLQIKLDGFDLLAISPPGDAKLPDQLDEYESRLRRLERAVVEGPKPSLEGLWRSGHLHLAFTVPAPSQIPSLEDEAEALPAFTQDKGLGFWTLPMPTRRMMMSGPRQGEVRVNQQVAEQYNNLRSEYLKAYEIFHRQERLRLSRHSRVIPLHLVFKNVGRAPANRLRVTLELPDGLVTAQGTPPEGAQGEVPKPPPLPAYGMRLPMTAAVEQASGYYPYFPPPDDHFVRLAAHTAEAKYASLQHGDAWSPPALVVIADEGLVGSEVRVRATMRADELPEPQTAELTLGIARA